MLKVTFVNYELGFDSGMQTLVGQGGQHYGGPSVWSQQHACQRIDATFKDQRTFEEAQKNLALTFSLYGRRWVAIAIKEVIEPAAAPIPEPFVPPSNEEAQFIPPSPIERVNDRMSAGKLREIAAKHHIDVSDLVTRAELRDAIQLEIDKRALESQSAELATA